MMKTTPKMLMSMTVALLLVFSGTSISATVNWDAVTGNWTVAENWDPAGVPAAGDDAYIRNGGEAIVNTEVAIRQIRVQNNAEITVQNGAHIKQSGNTWVGRDDGEATIGTVNMSGGLWENTSGTSREFHLGWNRDGTLEMTGGTIDKYRWFVGYNATMNMSGGTINSSNPFRLGGGNSLSYTPVLNLSGTAEINLGGGAHFYGAGGGSNAVVNQSGGTFNMAGSFQAGNTANSEFTYNLSGGEFNHTHNEFYLANASGVTATINITGGVLDTTADIVQRNNTNAIGNLTISGGQLMARNNVYLNADAAGAIGTFKVSGSGATEITIAERLQVTNGNILAFELDSGGITTINTGNWVSLNGANVTLDTLAGFSAVLGQEFDLVYTTDLINGIVFDTNTSFVNLSGDYLFDFYVADLGDDGSVLRAVVIPEPATLTLLGLGFLGTSLIRKKRA